jgi:hypothetical protein
MLGSVAAGAGRECAPAASNRTPARGPSTSPLAGTNLAAVVLRIRRCRSSLSELLWTLSGGIVPPCAVVPIASVDCHPFGAIQRSGLCDDGLLRFAPWPHGHI